MKFLILFLLLFTNIIILASNPAKVYYNNISDSPMRGAKDAIVTIVQYSEFQCPFCARIEPTMERILDEYPKKVRIIWKNFPLGFHKNAMPAAEAAHAIFVLKGNDAFWQANRIFFKNQRKLSPELYEEVARDLGVDMTKFKKAMREHLYIELIKKQMSEASKIGTKGTPASYINGRFLSGAQAFQKFKTLIDEEIKKAELMVKNGVDKTEVYNTLMKKAERKATISPKQRKRRAGKPDPAKVYFNDIKNGPMKGTEDALITIVQYSEFQCPYCLRVEPTIDRVLKEYDGKVKVVWMNNPLNFHKNAMPAAEAAYAIFILKGNYAFWAAHKVFFKNQRKLSSELYEKTAKNLGVDMDKFEDMISKHVFKKVIKDQQAQGTKIGARGTPAFFINGRFLSGAQPFDNFKKIIDEELVKAKAMLKKGTPKAKIYDTLMKNAERSLK